MFTRCPECNTYFRVTAAQLKAAGGEVCCGTCAAKFNALETLSDEIRDIPEGHNRGDEIPDEPGDDDDRDEIPDEPGDDDDRDEIPDEPRDDDDRDEIPDEPGDDDDRDEVPDEPGDDDDRDEDESWRTAKSLPPWQAGESEPDDSTRIVIDRPPREWIITGVVLGLMLVGQLLHYNRDALAAHPQYGGIVRGFYNGIGSTIYPEWRLNAFEVRGTEAVAGGGSSPALNILAKVLVVSTQPVGMPLIRVVLHDRWSDPVASGIFRPDEYLGDNGQPPQIVAPGTTLSIRISVADPGDEARGYVVDICLPRRTAGLECQLVKDPFMQ